MIDQMKFEEKVRPMARLSARPLSADEIDAVSGAAQAEGTVNGTQCKTTQRMTDFECADGGCDAEAALQ